MLYLVSETFSHILLLETRYLYVWHYSCALKKKKGEIETTDIVLVLCYFAFLYISCFCEWLTGVCKVWNFLLTGGKNPALRHAVSKEIKVMKDFTGNNKHYWNINYYIVVTDNKKNWFSTRSYIIENPTDCAKLSRTKISKTNFCLAKNIKLWNLQNHNIWSLCDISINCENLYALQRRTNWPASCCEICNAYLTHRMKSQ